jgi:hypothetical protein
MKPVDAETRGHEKKRVPQTAVISETFHVEQAPQDWRYRQLRDAYHRGVAPVPHEGWRVTGYELDFGGSDLVTVTLRVEEPG